MQLLKKNWGFIVLLIAMLFIFLGRYYYYSTDIVSNPDSDVILSTNNSSLEQTWETTAKIINNVRIPFSTEDDFVSAVKCSIYTDDYSEILAIACIPQVDFSACKDGSLNFNFGNISVNSGERYRIRLELVDPDGSGALSIKAGSNYGGCIIDGIDENKAAAISVGVAKYSNLFWMFSVIAPICFGSLLIMIIFERKFEEVCASSLFFEGILLYPFGMIGKLSLGIMLIYFIALVCLIASIVLYNVKMKNFKELISPGLFVFFIMYLLIIITSKGNWLGNRDELRHWGIAVRDMFYFDSFANHVGSTVILTRYLPFSASIEYVFEYMNGIFSEDILFIAYQTMLLCVLLIVWKPLMKSRKISIISLIIAAFICIPIIFFNNLSSSIMVDSFLAVITAYILICYFDEKLTAFNGIRIISAMVVLAMTKDVGLILAAMICVIMLIDIASSQIMNRKLIIRKVLYPVVCGMVALAVFFSWQLYLSKPALDYQANSTDSISNESADGNTEIMSDDVSNNEWSASSIETSDTAISASGMSVSGILSVIKGNGEDYQYEVTRRYLTELFDGSTYNFGTVGMSFFDLLVISAFIIIILGYFGFWKLQRKRMYFFAISSIIASFILCAFIQVAYWFSFSSYDALDLTSFSRYFAPYICAVMITVLYLIVAEAANRTDNRYYNSFILFLAVVIMICTPVSNIVRRSKDNEDSTTKEVTYGHGEIASILRSVANKGDRAYFICSNSDGYSEYIFRNTVCPILSLHENWNIVNNEEYNKQESFYGSDNLTDNKAVILSKDAWTEELRDCDYVVVFHADELFNESYGEVFGNTPIKDGSVYKVISNESSVKLSLIGSTGIKEYH